MTRRFWFITVSLGAHLAAGVAIYISGVWRVDRLDYEHQSIATPAVMAPPPPPSGGGENLPAQRVDAKPPRKIVTTITQPPPEKPPEMTPTATTATTIGTGTTTGPGTPGPGGPGTGDQDGTCETPPCGETKTKEE